MLQERYGAQRTVDITSRALSAFGGVTVEELNLHVANNYSEKCAQVVNLVTGATKLAAELLDEGGSTEGAEEAKS
eukprot:94927-Amphidinium_carterae.1